jgi:hypothetical protein
MIKKDDFLYLRRRVLVVEGSGHSVRPTTRTLINI